MDADRNLLFGVLALQADAITATQFIDACTTWAGRKGMALAELLIDRGWITAEERATVEHLMALKLKKHGGDPHASLAAVADDPVRRALAEIDSPEVRGTLTHLPEPPGHVLLSTIAYTPETRERYTLTRLHAQGGLGQVWLARDADLGREVALKELRPERASNPTIWARFLEEARITGQLEHPNIVPVHELVKPGEGHQPFYTMRFVKGRTLTEAISAYHRTRQTGQAAPLDLLGLVNAFVGVCNAVAYAHSRGVIHRDLKGQNVVLGDFGEVVVLDWGLAKQVDRPEETLTPPVSIEHGGDWVGTVAGQALGTPAYMAPEQAEGRLDQIDQRTDVYGLGAILYEVLAGRPPFSGESAQEVLRRVCQDEPTRPRQLNAQAPPALQAICLKALAKRPDERYGSAADLARDVQRWLADEPVSAYREPLSRRAGRWARRHKPLVASAAALLVTAVVALSVSTVLINRERARAEESFRQARQAVDDYFTAVSESKLLNVPGLQPLRKELLDSARKYYQGFLEQRGGDRSVRAELAATHYRVATITQMIGSKVDAEAAYNQARALYEELVRDRPAINRYRNDLAICCNDLGNLLRGLGRPDDAMRIHRRALELREALARDHRDGAPFQNQLAKSYGNLGDLLIESGKPDEALASYSKARVINEALVGRKPAVMEFPSDLIRRYYTPATFQLDLAIDYDMIGYLHERLGPRGDGLRWRERATSILEGLVRDHPDVTDYRSRLAGSYNGIGYVLSRTGQPDRALAYYERARKLVEALTAENPDVTNFRNQLAGTYNNIGRFLREQGRLEEAVRIYSQALVIQQALVRDHPDVVGYQSTLAYLYRGLGRLQAQRGQKSEALQSFRKAQGIDEKLAPTYPLCRYDLACDLALCLPLVDAGERPTLADRAMDELRRAIRAGYKNDHSIKTDPDLAELRPRADFLELIGDLDESGKTAAR